MGFLDELRVDIDENKKVAKNPKDKNKPKKKTNADMMQEIAKRKLGNLPSGR